MKEAVAKISFAAAAAVLCVGLQSVCGTVFGAKPPLAAAAVLWLALEYGAPAAPVAVFAGALCDALSCTPALCTPAFMLLAAAAVLPAHGSRRARSPAAGAALAAAAAIAGAAWLWLWTGAAAPFAGAVPAGALAGAAVFAVLNAARSAFALGAAAPDGAAGESPGEQEASAP